MCITVNHASLAGTKILSIPLENGNHFIAYSNKVQNLSGKPNAMILPIPGETSPELFHDTTKYKDFMSEIIKKCGLDKYRGILTKSIMRSRSLSDDDDLSFDKFDLGMYTVGLAKGFNGVRDFLESLSEEKRPVVSEELKKFFEEKYAGWSFAVCVFDSNKAIDAQPIAFEYKPFENNLIYFPTMDGHDGGAPDENESVRTDHTFIYEHTGTMQRDKFIKEFVSLDAEVPEFLQDKKYRATLLKGHHKNGDTFIDANKMKDSDFTDEPEFKRIQPVPYLAQ
jgi:hypothetical protein